jgi:hypothetical protein
MAAPAPDIMDTLSDEFEITDNSECTEESQHIPLDRKF